MGCVVACKFAFADQGRAGIFFAEGKFCIRAEGRERIERCKTTHQTKAAEPWQRLKAGQIRKRDPMKLHTLPATMAAVLLLLPAPAMFAAPFFNRSVPSPLHVAKVKTITFQVRNATSEAMSLKAGEQTATLQPGQTLELKLPTGASVRAATTTSHYEAGSLLTSVSDMLQGNTLILN